jgi:exodeoxyribonuclease VII large subunit
LNIIENKNKILVNLKSTYVLMHPETIIEKYKHVLALIINSLNGLNPLGILAKGYSVVSSKKKIIKSVNDLKVKDIVNVKLCEGEITAEVKEIN